MLNRVNHTMLQSVLEGYPSAPTTLGDAVETKQKTKEEQRVNISHFDKIRIVSESGASSVFMDIDRFPDGCSSGFMATAYEIPAMPKEQWASHKIEVRRKERQVALLTYKYPDSEIPGYWKDAEVLYVWEQAP